LARHDTTTVIQGYIDRLLNGDESARAELLRCASDRLRLMARKMLKGFPVVAGREQDDDIANSAWIRLEGALRAVTLTTARHFFRLVATEVRRELIDLARKYQRIRKFEVPYPSQPEREGSSADGVPTPPSPPDTTNDPGKLAAWSEFHRAVEELGDVDREMFDLLWYQGLSKVEAAGVLDVAVRTVHNRWVMAKLHLRESFGGHFPF
jgi:RNA polymerase sigma factor (sigma-70 family)